MSISEGNGAEQLRKMTVRAKQMQATGYSNSEIATHMGISENYVQSLVGRDEINWGYNCLTQGIHHGRPEKIWNIPLMQAISIFRSHVLKGLVIARIYNDALQYVDNSPFVQKGTGATAEITPEWATRIREISEERYDRILQHKVGEINNYYASPGWELEQQEAVRRVIEDKLNPGYAPLHPHDSINMLCRILGVSSAMKVS